MIDLHSHLLFGVDDGAKDENATRRMLEVYAAQGVTAVAATSHSSVLPDEYQRVFAAVAAWATTYGIELLPGREYALPDTAEQHSCLQPLGKGNALLLDLGTFPVNTGLCNRLGELPHALLLAHPERLWGDSSLKNARFLDDYRICFLQVTGGAFLGKYGRDAENAAWQLLNAGFCSIVASDAHRSREIDLAECRELLGSYYPDEVVDLLFETNPRRILAGEPPLPVIPKISLKTKIRQFFRPLWREITP